MPPRCGPPAEATRLKPPPEVPTLVIIGRHDPATVPEAGDYVRTNIPGAEHFIIDAAHISNIEQPQRFTDAVLGFLTRR